MKLLLEPLTRLIESNSEELNKKAYRSGPAPMEVVDFKNDKSTEVD